MVDNAVVSLGVYPKSVMRFNGVVCVEWQWGQSMNRWLGKDFGAQLGDQTGKRFPKFRRSVLADSFSSAL